MNWRLPSNPVAVVLVTGVLFVNIGCSRSSSPDTDQMTSYVVTLNDNKVELSLPEKGSAGPPFENRIESNVDLHDDLKYSEGLLDVGVYNSDWKSGFRVNGSLTLLIKVMKRIATVESHGLSLAEVLIREDLASGDEERRQFARDYPMRIKDVVRFREDGPRWLRHDYGDTDGLIDQGEDFALPLDNEHILLFRFRFTNNAGDDLERQKWYAEAEQIADEIMASVTIDRGSLESTIEYGAPDGGLVIGQVRYREDLTSRIESWPPEE